METVLQIIIFFGINFFIWWLLKCWGNISRAYNDQWAWWYLSWDDDALYEQHKYYIDMMNRNEKRGMCIQRIEAIKAALEMRQKIRVKGPRNEQQ